MMRQPSHLLLLSLHLHTLVVTRSPLKGRLDEDRLMQLEMLVSLLVLT